MTGTLMRAAALTLVLLFGLAAGRAVTVAQAPPPQGRVAEGKAVWALPPSLRELPRRPG